jgi:hypothetical protein
MQVSSLQDGSIQFQSGNSYLTVTQPSERLARFFAGGGVVECDAEVAKVMNLQPSGLIFSSPKRSGEEFENGLKRSPAGYREAVGATLVQAGLVQIVYENGETAPLVMSGSQIYRLVQAMSEKKNLFLLQESGEWICFPREIRFLEARGEEIGRFQIWSPEAMTLITVSGIDVRQKRDSDQVLVRLFVYMKPPHDLVLDANWFCELMFPLCGSSSVAFWQPVVNGLPRLFFFPNTLSDSARQARISIYRAYPEIRQSYQDGIAQRNMALRCPLVSSIEVEYLGGVGDEQSYLLRFSGRSGLGDKGWPVSAVQVATLAEIREAVKVGYNSGLMFVPGSEPQIRLQLSTATRWSLSPSSADLKEVLSSVEAKVEVRDVQRQAPFEVTLVLAHDTFYLEVRNPGEIVSNKYDRLSTEQYATWSQEGSGYRFFKRAPTGCVPLSWEEFEFAVASQDRPCPTIRRARVLGLKDTDLVELEVTSVTGRTACFRISIDSIHRIVANLNRPNFGKRDLYLPSLSPKDGVVRWICFGKEMELLTPSGQPMRGSLDFIEEIYHQSYLSPERISILAIEDHRATIVLQISGGMHRLSLNCNMLFGILSAVRDGEPTVIKSSIEIEGGKLPLKFRLTPEKCSSEQATEMLRGLLPHVSESVANLPIKAFSSGHAFPVGRVVVSSIGNVYHLECFAQGTNVNGMEVSISTVALKGDFLTICKAVRRGVTEERMLFSGPLLQTKMQISMEITEETQWDWSGHHPFEKRFGRVGKSGLILLPLPTSGSAPVEKAVEVKERVPIKPSSSEELSNPAIITINEIVGEEGGLQEENPVATPTMGELEQTMTFLNNLESLQDDDSFITANELKSDMTRLGDDVKDLPDLIDNLVTSQALTSDMTDRLVLLTEEEVVSYLTISNADSQTPGGSPDSFKFRGILELTLGEPVEPVTSQMIDTAPEPTTHSQASESPKTFGRTKYYLAGSLAAVGAAAAMGLWQNSISLHQLLNRINIRK